MSESEYEEGLKRLEQLMDEHPAADLTSPEGKEIEQLSIALDAYEKEHFPI